jgi:hypothetical protein
VAIRESPEAAHFSEYQMENDFGLKVVEFFVDLLHNEKLGPSSSGMRIETAHFTNGAAPGVFRVTATMEVISAQIFSGAVSSSWNS